LVEWVWVLLLVHVPTPGTDDSRRTSLSRQTRFSRWSCSNNDGCSVPRVPEAKAVEIPMGAMRNDANLVGERVRPCASHYHLVAGSHSVHAIRPSV
jgi:hypothetical protein